MDICPKCGLPREACVCQEIAKEKQKIKIETTTRRYHKVATLISGLDTGINIKEIAKNLKSTLACGGTIKNNTIELQGNHKKKAREILISLGFPEETIE